MKVAELLGGDLAPKVLPGWRRTTLGEIGEYINGRGFKKSEWATKGLPIIRIQNLTGTGKEQNYYDGEIDERHVVNTGDLLISWAATLGAYLWAGPRAALNQHIFKVRSFIDKKFHYYLMQHILGDLYRQTHGSGMVHITKSKFDSIPIVVPVTEDQQKEIVAEIEKQFSRLDEAVANLKRVKANLKRYKAAVLKAAVEGCLVETEAEIARREDRSYEPGEQLLQRILETRRSQWKGKGKYKEPAAPNTTDLPELPEGWAWANIDQLAEVGTGATPRRDQERYYGGDIPWVTSAVVNNTFVDCASDFVTNEALAETNLTLYPPGTLLVAMYGEGKTRGKCSELRIAATTNQALAALRVDENVRSYLKQFLEYNYEEMRKTASGGVQPNLNLSLVRAVCVPLPPLMEQRRIVADLDRYFSLIREAENQVDTNLKRAERMRQSILASAFSGKLQ